jgi:hypothetical protein
MVPRTSTPPKGSATNSPPGDGTANFVRWGLLVVGSGMLGTSLLLKWQPSLLPRGTEVAIDMTARIGVVCVAAWLAWPMLASLRRVPGGVILVAGVILTFVLFAIRKQTIYVLGPYMAVAIVLALVVGWLRKLRR